MAFLFCLVRNWAAWTPVFTLEMKKNTSYCLTDMLSLIITRAAWTSVLCEDAFCVVLGLFMLHNLLSGVHAKYGASTFAIANHTSCSEGLPSRHPVSTCASTSSASPCLPIHVVFSLESSIPRRRFAEASATGLSEWGLHGASPFCARIEESASLVIRNTFCKVSFCVEAFVWHAAFKQCCSPSWVRTHMH